jgi:hypothetical protein
MTSVVWKVGIEVAVFSTAIYSLNLAIKQTSGAVAAQFSAFSVLNCAATVALSL